MKRLLKRRKREREREEEKRRALKAAIKSFETDIEEYSIAAETENNLTLLTKANSFKVTVR